MHEAKATNQKSRRVTLQLSAEEADALLSLLLQAEPCTEVSEEMTDQLLCRIAGVQRELVRRCYSNPRVIRRRSCTNRTYRRVSA